jgi:DNA-binding Lrp family transcriptional regulator
MEILGWLDYGVWKQNCSFCFPSLCTAIIKPQSPTYIQFGWKDVKKLPTAYVLLNTEIGSERDVLHAIKGIEGVQEAFRLWGIYDIVARVKADTIDKLNQIIGEKLQFSKVHSKMTVMVTEA